MTSARAMLASIAATACLIDAGVVIARENDMDAKTKATVAPARNEIYSPVTLDADISALSADERKMLGLFIDAADIMHGLFWRQTYGDKMALLNSIKDPAQRRFAEINYGPWDRLESDVPFVPGVGPKPPGAQFYPLDMTKQEFEAANLPDSRSEYTLLRRDAA